MKWNDKGPVIPKRRQLLYGICIVGSFALSLFHYFAYGFFNVENLVGMSIAGFLIYGIWFGGLYKISRYVAERNAKKSDNDFSPYKH